MKKIYTTLALLFVNIILGQTPQVIETFGEITPVTNVYGDLFFGVYNGSSALFKNNGSIGGTTLVKNGPYPVGYVNMESSSAVSNNIYYFISTIAGYSKIWRSDGINSGTYAVGNTQVLGTLPNSIVTSNNLIYFQGTDATNGGELWKSDGTSAGTMLVKNINNTNLSSNISNIFSFNGSLYFSANNGTSGNELWKTDGSTAGTVLVKDIVTGSDSSDPKNFTISNNTLYFTALGGLWKTDGTIVGTVRISYASDFYSPQYLVDVNGILYFDYKNSTTGIELWKSDGTTIGTTLVKDIAPGSDDSFAEKLINVNGTLFFKANFNQLWKSDGSSVGTVLVKNGFVNSFPEPSLLSISKSVNGILYFNGRNNVAGNELWKSDGTTAGTIMVSDLVTGVNPSNPSNLIQINNDLFFKTKPFPSSNDTLYKLAVAPLSQNKFNQNLLISIYPNPTNSILSIETQEKITSISLINILGKKTNISNFENNKIDVSALQNGVYFIEIATEKGLQTQKFIKN